MGMRVPKNRRTGWKLRELRRRLNLSPPRLKPSRVLIQGDRSWQWKLKLNRSLSLSRVSVYTGGDGEAKVVMESLEVAETQSLYGRGERHAAKNVLLSVNTMTVFARLCSAPSNTSEYYLTKYILTTPFKWKNNSDTYVANQSGKIALSQNETGGPHLYFSSEFWRAVTGF